MKAAHYRGTYHVRSLALKAAAYANPDTRCIGDAGCGLTLTEGIARWGYQRAKWTAGHVNPGEVDGPLVPQHLHCNSSDGARYGNQQRNHNRTSRNW